MIAFLVSTGYILCFLIGAYVSWRFTEYYNQKLRDALLRQRRTRREPPEDLFETETEKPSEG